MPTTFIPGDEKQDEKLNPGQQHADRQFSKIAKAEENGTFNDIVNNYDKTADPSDEDASIRKLREQESRGERASWKNNVENKSDNVKKKLTIKGFSKKKGALAAILSMLGIGGFGMAVMFSPSWILIQMKETYSEKFNDQLSTMTVRSNRALAKKIGKTVTGGVCSPVTIRCKYQTMSKRQIAKLQKAGIEVMDENNNPLTSRGRAHHLTIDGKEYDASALQKELRTNARMRSAFNRAYNPKVAAFTDAISQKTNLRLKISKKNNLKDATKKEDLNKTLRSSISAEDFAIQNDPGIITEKDKNGNDVYKDKDSGRVLTSEEIATRQADFEKFDTETLRKKSLTETNKIITKSSIKGALTVTALGAGAVDSACTGYTLIRTVGFAAKYIGMLQLARYAHTFMNTADAIKAGDATPEQVEYLGNILTSTNSVGKSATDSYGYKYAVYGDVLGKPSSDTETIEQGKLADETLRYTNGQLVSTNVLTSIINAVSAGGTTKSADEVCKFVKSGWGQGLLVGAAAAGAVAAFISGGLSLGWGTAAQVGVSVTIGIAIGIVTPKLIDMASSTFVTGDENGNEAGNAITSGMGAYNAQSSQSRGLAVLTKEDAIAYQNLTSETVALYNEVEKNETNPFDASNKNTFVGSFVSKTLPYIQKGSSTSIVGSLFGPLNAASRSINSILSAKAAGDDEFNQCSDPEYEERNLAADPFCNLKYGLSVAALDIDPEVVLDYMISGQHIDEISGEPTSDEFKGYIKNCVDRTNSIGGFSEDNLDTGEGCIQGGEDNERNTYFRLYLVDSSIINEMDEETKNSTNTDPGQIGAPDNTKPIGSGWTLKDNADYSSVACASGMEDGGLYTHPIGGFTFRKCAIGGAYVNSLVSQQVLAMVEAAKNEGTTLEFSNSFRSYAEQQALYKANCSGTVCNPPTAVPGKSQHERGLAIDFSACDNKLTSCYKWLAQNAATYGYYNLPSEPWHWSVSGN